MKSLAILSRYKNAITYGILAGLLISNIILMINTNANQVAIEDNSVAIKEQIQADNKERETIRRENIERDFQTQRYIACIAKILIQTKGQAEGVRIESLDTCTLRFAGDTSAPTTKQEKPLPTAPAPQQVTKQTPRQEPTTSMPPEDKSVTERLLDGINGIVDRLL